MPCYWQFVVSTTRAGVDVRLAPDDASGWADLIRRHRIEQWDRLTLGGSLEDCVVFEHLQLSTPRKTLPDAFLPSIGFTLISERFRAVLESVELGDVEFSPVQISRKSGEPFAEDFFVLQVRNRKDTLVEAKTPGKPFGHRLFGHTHRFPWSPESPPTITLSPAALEGPHLWRETREVEMLYASDELMKACRTEKIRGLFQGCQSALDRDPLLECAPAGGPFGSVELTPCGLSEEESPCPDATVVTVPNSSARSSPSIMAARRCMHSAAATICRAT